MYVLDCGKNSSTLYNSDLDTNPSNQPPSEESLQCLSHKDVLKLYKTLPSGSKLFCEYAHLGCPRKSRSKAQPFTGEQLLEFYDNLEEAGISLLLTPQQSTPRAQNRSRLPKSDKNDPKSICLLLKEYPEISLMKPPTSFQTSKKRKESYGWVDESNIILNNQRGEDYNPENPLYQFIVNHTKEIFDELPVLVEDAFSKKGSARFKSNSKSRGPNEQKGDINVKQVKLSQFYSVLCQMMNEEGELRFRDRTDQLAGWKFVKRYAIRMSPFHLKGGVARSNLYFHGMRHWASRKAAEELGMKKETFLAKRRGGYTDPETDKYVEPMTHREEQTYLKYRRQYCKAVKLLYIECKRILEREYNLLETNNGVHVLMPTLA